MDPLAAAIPPVGHHARSDPGLAQIHVALATWPGTCRRVLGTAGRDRGPRPMRMPEHWDGKGAWVGWLAD